VVQEFGRLEKISLGGTKGRQLTESFKQVHVDFTKAVERLKTLPYDILDIKAVAFDDDFYKWRCQVKGMYSFDLDSYVCFPS